MNESDIEKITNILSSDKSIVYFLRCNEFVKVGTTKGGLLRRIADLNVGNPYDLELDWFIMGGNEKEKKIHKLLEKYWVRGEWHKINRTNLIKLIKGI